MALLLERATVEVEAFGRRLVGHWLLSRKLTLTQSFPGVLDLPGHLSNLAVSPEHLRVLWGLRCATGREHRVPTSMGPGHAALDLLLRLIRAGLVFKAGDVTAIRWYFCVLVADSFADLGVVRARHLLGGVV